MVSRLPHDPLPDPPPGVGPARPVIGIESEFELRLDGERVRPEDVWTRPDALVPSALGDARSAVLPSGGALYFDGGVLELVTPLVEAGRGSALRAVRQVWKEIAFLRLALDRWSAACGREARLVGFSTHYNVSFEAPPDPARTLPDLAHLLAYLLPLPLAFTGANRRSTGIGVRPRGNRVEVTTDFTPDPALMIATATLLVGVVRGTMGWPSYALGELDRRRLPVPDGVHPGRHSSRRGWLTRDHDWPRSPFTTDADARLWALRDGRTVSLRALAREVAWAFRHEIRRDADPFSFRLLFSILEGRSPSLLELADRPAAYDDVGRRCRWGEPLAERVVRARDGRWVPTEHAAWSADSFAEHVTARERERARHLRRLAREEARVAKGAHRPARLETRGAGTAPGLPEASGGERATGPRRESLVTTDRRRAAAGALALQDDGRVERRLRPAVRERRMFGASAPRSEAWPDPGHSPYERVFLRLGLGATLEIGGERYRPVAMRGWYHAVLRRDSDGARRVFSIDELADALPGG